MQNKEKILSALQKKFPDMEISINISKSSFITKPEKYYDRVLVSINDNGEFAVMNDHPMDVEQTIKFIADKISASLGLFGKKNKHIHASSAIIEPSQ